MSKIYTDEESKNRRKEASNRYYHRNKELVIAREKCRPNEDRLLRTARSRAKSTGSTFNIDVSDINIPTHCPILGLPLVRGEGKLHAGSPTLDRVDNNFGYVKGNVRVISFKANTMKRDLTISTCERLIKYMKGEI